MRDILEVYRENLRIKARAQFIEPEVLVAMDAAVDRLFEACDEDYAQTFYLIEYVFCDRFLDYGWEEAARKRSRKHPRRPDDDPQRELPL